MKRTIFFTLAFALTVQIFANPFNNKIKDEEIEKLQNGEILIRNSDTIKNLCLLQDFSEKGNGLLDFAKNIKPKYIAEVIQFKPYEGNEDFEEKLEQMLFEVEKFTDIPYTTSSGGQYLLYDSAEILNQKKDGGHTNMQVRMYMDPFADVFQDMDIYKSDDELLYTSKNTNKLRYRDDFDCLNPEKMMTCIYLFRDGDHWVFYAVGGVNAPHIPFLTERIRRSFMNRINTFCNYIFKKF